MLSEKKKPVEFRIRKSPSGAIIRKSFTKTPAPRDELLKDKKASKEAGFLSDPNEGPEQKAGKPAMQINDSFRLEQDNPLEDTYKDDF